MDYTDSRLDLPYSEVASKYLAKAAWTLMDNAKHSIGFILFPVWFHIITNSFFTVKFTLYLFICG